MTKTAPKTPTKPCLMLRYCPYGILVEDFPVIEDQNQEFGCPMFGHICPVYQVAEKLSKKDIQMIERGRIPWIILQHIPKE